MTVQDIINDLNDYIENPTYMIDPDLLDELSKRMDRVKELMDGTGLSIEEMLSESANVNLDCAKCVLRARCAKLDLTVYKKTGLYYTCNDIWEEYLKGETDGKA